jgi:hypothetical protein
MEKLLGKLGHPQIDLLRRAAHEQRQAPISFGAGLYELEEHRLL